ncbi:hypothetical protein BC832DRAFT_566842 [Gaertneriomyces semiglobifer]|nr:hypothetical protein BC832DRAFT_566842 [Gaertneriomyces semiglobifer]
MARVVVTLRVINTTRIPHQLITKKKCPTSSPSLSASPSPPPTPVSSKSSAQHSASSSASSSPSSHGLLVASCGFVGVVGGYVGKKATRMRMLGRGLRGRGWCGWRLGG